MTISESLFDRFFQVGYVARDADGAMAEFNKRFGPVEWQVTMGSDAHPHTKRIALTYRDGLMIEIIEANDAVPSIYRDYLPSSGPAMRFHHLGYLVEDYPATIKRLEAEGYDVPFKLSYGDVVDCCYVDTRGHLGHYVEYVRLGKEGQQWFASVPGFRGFPAAR